MGRERTLGRVRIALLALSVPVALAGWSRAEGPGHGGWGMALDHGVGPDRGAYDVPFPGWRPGPECGRHGHDVGPRSEWRFLNSHSPYVRTGLYRYPLFGFGGYIPAGPHDDALYRTGRGPLKR